MDIIISFSYQEEICNLAQSDVSKTKELIVDFRKRDTPSEAGERFLETSITEDQAPFYSIK